MKRPSDLPLLFLSLISLPSLSFGQPPTCQAQATDGQMAQALFAEVRQLRITVERSVSLVSRMQLALTRFQMQQTRVDRLSRELQDFRSQLEATAANRENITSSLRELESQAQSDPSQRNRVEGQTKFFKSQLEQIAATEQEERTRELQLST